jgi:hypothetical protein
VPCAKIDYWIRRHVTAYCHVIRSQKSLARDRRVGPLAIRQIGRCLKDQTAPSRLPSRRVSLHSSRNLAREFTKALTAADRAHAIIPADRSFEINRAHALMFLGRGEESKPLYLAQKGKPLPGQGGKLWEHVIVEDFAEFRKAGLTHPMMADIEKELGVSP